MKFIFSAVLMLYAGLAVAQTYNRPVPEGLFPYNFYRYQSSFHGYYLTIPFKLNVPSAPLASLVLLDEDGYIAWYMQPDSGFASDFNYFPQHGRYTFMHWIAPSAYYKVMDQNFNLVDAFTNVNGVTGDAHEMQILPNGNYLIGGAKDSVVDLSAYTFNGYPGSANCHITGYVIQEFDPAHNLVFQWNSNDYIHPSETYDFYGYNPNGFDYCHGNAIEQDTDGNYLVSFRHLNSIYKIDRNTGNIIWKLGGNSGDFSFPNDIGFSGQHDVRRLPNGNISLFDNANMSPPPRKTRAVEYSIDTVTWEATKVWEYIYSPSFFAFATGGHQTTHEDYHLINWGLLNRPNPSVTFVDDNDNLVADIFFADTVVSYRSHIYEVPFTFTRPEINCSRVNNMLTLSAPSGFAKYAWSTGDTTQSIMVMANGVYQVWVNHTNGMLGSLPYEVTDINSECFTGIPGMDGTVQEKKIMTIYDLAGREMAYPQKGQLYIIRYDDGSARLTMWTAY